MEGAVALQPLLVSEKRVIALLCGIKISAVHHLFLSQSTRVTDRQNYDSYYRTSIAARVVKTHSWHAKTARNDAQDCGVGLSRVYCDRNYGLVR